MALALCWAYQDLNSTGLSDIKVTDLIEHRVHVIPGARPYAARYRRRTSPEQDEFIVRLSMRAFNARLGPCIRGASRPGMLHRAWLSTLTKNSGLRLTTGVSTKSRSGPHRQGGG